MDGRCLYVIRWLHVAYGYVNVRLVCNLLIAVCVVQCLIAWTKDVYSPLQTWIDSFVGGEAFMGNTKDTRLSGIGAALDVAGLRFSAVAVMIGFILSKQKNCRINRCRLSCFFLDSCGDWEYDFPYYYNGDRTCNGLLVYSTGLLTLKLKRETRNCGFG